MAIFSEDYVNKIKENNKRIVITEDYIYKNTNDKYSISIDIGEGRESSFLLDPYIKIYNSPDFRKATKVARINLITGNYISHEGKPLLNINSSVLKWIINTLLKPSTNRKYSNMTVYDAIWAFIYETGEKYKLKYAEKVDINIFINNLKENR